MRTNRLIAAAVLIALFATADGQSRRPAQRPPVQEQIDQLAAENAALRRRIADLEKELDEIKSRFPAPTRDEQRIADAVRRGKIVVGMTLAQVEDAADGKASLVTSSGNVNVYRWRLATPKKVIDGGADYPQLLFGEFTSGKLTGIELRRSPEGGPDRAVAPGSLGPGVR